MESLLQLEDTSGEIVMVECSPDAENTLRKDPELYSQLLSQSFEAQSEKSSQKMKMEDDYVVNDVFQNADEEENSSSNKAVWLDNQCSLLIEAYKEIRPRLGNQLDVKNKKKMWVSISKKMIEKGHNFTPFQVENKWKSLQRSFKRKITHNKKPGKKRASSSFDKSLSEVMVKNPSEIPPFLLGSYDEGRRTKNEILLETGNEMNMSNASHFEEDITSTSTMPSVAKELRLLRESRAAEKTEEKKARSEYWKAKLKAYDNRTKETKRKNDILERFLKCFSERNKN